VLSQIALKRTVDASRRIDSPPNSDVRRRTAPGILLEAIPGEVAQEGGLRFAELARR
jgi:hypothetical protein